METDVWSVEEADSDSLSTAIKLLSLSCYNHGACTAILHSDVCQICVIVQFVVSNVYHFFYEFASSGFDELFDSLRRTNVDGI